MKMTFAKTASLLALVAALAAPAIASAQGVNDIVVDNRGFPVTDHRDQCVITKWIVGSNQCGIGTPRSYLVFFDFDRSALTSEARRILATLAEENKKADVKSIAVVGHTDRSGSDRYNLNLSKKRADSVKKALVKLGFAGNIIKTSAKGEGAPLVPTEDRVREPQNRRVEITIERK